MDTIWTWSIERWRETACGPEHDVLAGTHDVLAGDCQIGDVFGDQSEPINIRSVSFCSHF